MIEERVLKSFKGNNVLATGGTGAKVIFDPSKPSMIPIRLIDIAKAETILGFKTKTGLREGIGKTIEWYKKTYQPEKAAGTGS